MVRGAIARMVQTRQAAAVRATALPESGSGGHQTVAAAAGCLAGKVVQFLATMCRTGVKRGPQQAAVGIGVLAGAAEAGTGGGAMLCLGTRCDSC